MSPAAVAVRRARVHDTRGDPLAAELRLTRLFAAADVATGLPRGSLLIVRNLADPLPGALGLERHALRPPAAWERALGSSLFEIARRAARPALGAVPAGANAVFFADESEWLACFAREVAIDAAPMRWWLGEVLSADVQPRTALARALVARPRLVPATFARLSEWRVLPRLVALIGEEPAAAVAAAVAREFVVDPTPAPHAEQMESVPPELAAVEPSVVSLAALVAAVAPEVRTLPPRATEARRLVALALVLRRAPALTRVEAFPAALALHAAPGEAPAPLRRQERVVSVTPSRRTAARQTSFEPPPVVASARDPETPSASPPRAVVRRPMPQAAVDPLPLTVDERPGRIVATELGGVLFLTNVLLALGVYGDFTQPRRPGIELDFWRCLSLLGARLLVRRPQRHDPLWRLLAELAGPDAPHDWDDGAAIARGATCVRASLRAAGIRTDLLLRQPARIEVGETRVDATFELATHPIESRLAALDHDPGFVPAAGRTLAFHFA